MTFHASLSLKFWSEFSDRRENLWWNFWDHEFWVYWLIIFYIFGGFLLWFRVTESLQEVIIYLKPICFFRLEWSSDGLSNSLDPCDFFELIQLEISQSRSCFLYMVLFSINILKWDDWYGFHELEFLSLFCCTIAVLTWKLVIIPPTLMLLPGISPHFLIITSEYNQLVFSIHGEKQGASNLSQF